MMLSRRQFINHACTVRRRQYSISSDPVCWQSISWNLFDVYVLQALLESMIGLVGSPLAVLISALESISSGIKSSVSS